jgi:diguanylate cyclase (GGDEF)-like protein/PAS domain S-box-containing protein
MPRNTPWRVLLGVVVAVAGAVLVETLLLVGMQPLAPIGWPSLFLLLATAFGGFATLLGGAITIVPYFALNFAAVERFPAFYANPSMPWVWVVAFTVLGLMTATLRERVARASEAPFHAVAENLGALVSYIDADMHFRFNNRLYEAWFSLPRARITGRPVREVLHPDSYARIEPYIRRALDGERVEFEIDLRAGDRVRHIHGIFVPDQRPGGRVAGCYGIVSDISRLKAAEQELTLLAHYDALTGAMGRRLFVERLELAAARARRDDDPPALIFVDVDHFKAVNDSHGHAAGDALLKEFAARLRHCVRETDAVGRLGGDEFVLLLENVKSDANAASVAQKILESLRQPVVADGVELRGTASIGIALHDGEMSVEAWMKQADDALYEAKSAGRNAWREAK